MGKIEKLTERYFRLWPNGKVETRSVPSTISEKPVPLTFFEDPSMPGHWLAYNRILDIIEAEENKRNG